MHGGVFEARAGGKENSSFLSGRPGARAGLGSGAGVTTTHLDLEKVGGGRRGGIARFAPHLERQGKPWARHQQLGPWPSPQAASIAQTEGFATRPRRPRPRRSERRSVAQPVSGSKSRKGSLDDMNRASCSGSQTVVSCAVCEQRQSIVAWHDDARLQSQRTRTEARMQRARRTHPADRSGDPPRSLALPQPREPCRLAHSPRHPDQPPDNEPGNETRRRTRLPTLARRSGRARSHTRRRPMSDPPKKSEADRGNSDRTPLRRARATEERRHSG